MKNLNDLRMFIETAQLGSFSACARSMDTSPAVVSAAIKRLEQDLKTSLFIRSTRSLRLTQQGEQFLSHCRQAITLLDQAQAELHRGHSPQAISGTIKLTAPSALGRNLLHEWLDDFVNQHPKVELYLQFTDTPTDLYSHNADIALRYGEPKDSNMVALPICQQNHAILCAAPSYLARNGLPKTPKELLSHNCLCFGINDTLYTRWTFSKNGVEQTIHVSGNRRSKDSDIIYRWAIAGHGIALTSPIDVAKDIASGRLVVIDTGWQGVNVPLHLIYAEKRLSNPLIHCLHQHLLQCVSKL